MDITTLVADVYAEFVETPQLVQLADMYWGKIPEAEYRRRELSVSNEHHLHGSGIRYLRMTLRKYGGGIRDDYRRLMQRPDFPGDLDRYYAATVQHVMLRQIGGIAVMAVRAVTVPRTKTHI